VSKTLSKIVSSSIPKGRYHFCHGSYGVQAVKYSAADTVSYLNTISPAGDTAKQLLNTIRACCKSVPYSNEATLEARSKFFGLWYQFSPPSIIFTVSPGDECNFRVQLYSNPVKQQLPNAKICQSECIGDYLF